MTHLTALDLCAGVGGFHAAAQLADAEIDVVGALELDAPARVTYEALYGPGVLLEPHDIQEITRSEAERTWQGPLRRRETRRVKIRRSLPAVDLIMAGLPCQPHSLMGNRRGARDERGGLFFDVAEIVAAMEPTYVVLENVRALRSVNDGQLFQVMISTLRDLNYSTDVWVLDAQNYGVPQVRRRMFIVASTKGLRFDLPPEVPPTSRRWLTTWHLLDRTVDDRYYLSERILGTILKDQHKGYRRPADINRLTARPLTRTMHKMHRASQDNYYSDDFIRGRFIRPEWRVELAEAGGRIRRITPREAFRIQGFDDALVERAVSAGVSDTQLYMQAGNAVPPPLAATVLNHLL